MLPHGSQADSSPVARERLVMPNQKPRVVTHRASEETFIFNEEEYNADMEDTDEYDRAAAKLNRYMSDPEAAQKLEILTRQVSMSNWSDWSSSDKRPAGFDFADVLSESVRRMDEEGMELSHTGVSFTNVTTKGLQQGSEFGATASEPLRALQELPSRIKKTINPPLKNIIEGVDGYVEAGEMLMVVGRPGAGCTALLKTLAGEVDQFKGVEGDIEYDGIPFEKMMRNFKSDIIYNSEEDTHFPHLTVEQTLRFAIASRTPRTRFGTTSRKRYQDNMMELFMKVFGLSHASQTKVGNEYIAGVSGGERKRVSIAEAMAARGTMYCWDNATRGLDSSTALEYTRAIRASTNILRNVSIMAAYQASENIYNLFDKVTVLYSGKQIYFGHVSHAKEYFERMGFYCRPRQTTVEFLSAITDPNGRCIRNGYEGIAPQTVDEFVVYWRQSPEYMALVDERSRYSYLANPVDTVTRFRNVRAREKMAGQRTRSRYLLTYPAQLWLAVTRGFQRINGDRAYTIARLIGCVVQGVIVGTLFYNMSEGTSGAFSRSGIMFYALLFNILSPLSDIPVAFMNRPVILKQRGYSFYHPSVEALQNLVTDLPIRIILVLTFTVIFYFLSGMNNNAPQFFIYFLFSLLPTFCISTLFQLISASVKTVSAANSVAGVINSAFIIYTGYMIPTFSMHPWFKWINYINPLNYAFESMMTNEFHGREMYCNSVIPSGPGYEKVSRENQVCAFTGSLPGQSVISGDQYLEAEYRYEHGNLWRNFGILLGFWAFFVVLQAIFTEYLKPYMNKGNTLFFKRGYHPVDNGTLPFSNKRNSATSVLTQDHMMDSFFSWQDVNYTIPVKTKKKDQEKTRTLLQDVQGYVVPGKLTALMGESGAGKTTLLNVLSQRANFGTVTGDIYVNGRPVDETFKRRTGYVQQQDIHLSETTVRESLQFAARLRQPADVPDEEKLAYVEKVIDMLGMGSYADAFVGTVENGLTGEQRKKLSIGVELVAKPSLLLFLDEPTSGLDSQSAWAIVKLLRSLADSGQAILCTIHQPSATLFEQFDRLLLLAKGGKTVYFGDIGPNSQTMVNYFERNGARPCMNDENPAEYMLDCIGAGATATVIQDWAHVWENSKDFIAIKDEITNISIQTWQQPDRILKHELESKSFTRKYATGYLTQLKWMLWRTSVQYWRSPTYLYSKLILMVLVGLFAGFTYWKVDDSVVGLKNVLFSILLVLLLSAPLSNQIQAHVFPSRELFEGRENASNTFHWSILPLSHFLVELPYHILFSSILFCCFYFPTGYSTEAENAGMFYFVYCVLFQIYYISFSLLVVYISPDIPSAGALTSLLFTFKVAFCGVLQPKSEIPGFWTFMYKVSPYTYFVQSILGSILHNKPIACKSEEFDVFKPIDGMTCYEFAGAFISRTGGYLNNPQATDNCQYCQYRSGDEYLARVMDTEWSQRWRNVGFFFIYIVFNLLTMLALFYLFRIKAWNQNKSKPSNKKDNFFADAEATRANSFNDDRKGSNPSSRRRSATEGKEWWIKPEPSEPQKSHIDVSPYPPKA